MLLRTTHANTDTYRLYLGCGVLQCGFSGDRASGTSCHKTRSSVSGGVPRGRASAVEGVCIHST